MLSCFRPALMLVVLLTVITGLAYPLGITLIAQTVMPVAANGSLIRSQGKILGSSLIGQEFSADRYFHGRPSATAGIAYNAAASTGTNLGPTSQKLKDQVKAAVDSLVATGVVMPVPADAATASGSGLDPHISPAFALAQVERVAKTRGMTVVDLARLVNKKTEGRWIGLIGEPRVNVLALNMALDLAKP